MKGSCFCCRQDGGVRGVPVPGRRSGQEGAGVVVETLQLRGGKAVPGQEVHTRRRLAPTMTFRCSLPFHIYIHKYIHTYYECNIPFIFKKKINFGCAQNALNIVSCSIYCRKHCFVYTYTHTYIYTEIV